MQLHVQADLRHADVYAERLAEVKAIGESTCRHYHSLGSPQRLDDRPGMLTCQHKSSFDHGQCFLGQAGTTSGPWDRPRSAASTSEPRAQRSAKRSAQVVDEHVVKPDVTLFIEQDPIEHLDDRSNIDLQARLFEHFPRQAGFERLTEFQASARQDSTGRPAARTAV